MLDLGSSDGLPWLVSNWACAAARTVGGIPMANRAAPAEGLRRQQSRAQIHREKIANNDAAAQSHAMALENLRVWHRRRIEQALAKANDKPVARERLEAILPFTEKWPLLPESVKFLLVVEARLAVGQDIEERPVELKPRRARPEKPAWMRDPTLLPKRPPGK